MYSKYFIISVYFSSKDLHTLYYQIPNINSLVLLINKKIDK